MQVMKPEAPISATEPWPPMYAPAHKPIADSSRLTGTCVKRASPSRWVMSSLIQLSGRLATSFTPHSASSSAIRLAVSLRFTALFKHGEIGVNELAADHGGERPERLDLGFRHRKGVTREHHQIGQLAPLDRALQAFLEGQARIVDGADAQRFLARDALGGAVDAVGDRVARDEVIHRPERVVGNHR